MRLYQNLWRVKSYRVLRKYLKLNHIISEPFTTEKFI